MQKHRHSWQKKPQYTSATIYRLQCSTCGVYGQRSQAHGLVTPYPEPVTPELLDAWAQEARDGLSISIPHSHRGAAAEGQLRKGAGFRPLSE